MRLNLFWKFAFAFLALLVSVLLAVDFFAERSLRSDYERTGFEQLAAIARIAQARPPQWTPASPGHAEDLAPLRDWVAQMAASGARVTVIAADGRVLADSQSDPQTMENHANSPRNPGSDGKGRRAFHSPQRHHQSRSSLLCRAPEHIRGTFYDSCVLRFRSKPSTKFWVPSGAGLWLASFFILLIAGGISLLFSRSFTGRVERLKDFSRRVAEGDFRPLPRDGSGDAVEALGISLNRTAARLDRTIHTLTEERNLSSAILGSMVEGVAVVNGSERLVFANPGFAEILGLDVPPTSGSALVEVVRQTELLEAVRQVLGGEPRVQSEIVTGTLRQHYFAITVAAVRAGDTTGAVVVLHDITELRKLERVRRDFVANVSHEFRTPLTAIQGFAETLLAGAIDDSQNRTRFLEIILEHSRRLARLTEDLLMLSKMDAERLELEIRRLSVSQLIESCLETAQRRAAEKDLRISVNMPQRLPDIAGDRRRLAEVLQNLLDNAIQYTLPGGQIMRQRGNRQKTR